MEQPNDVQTTDECLEKGPQSALERNFIVEYLKGKGHRLETLSSLPEEEAKSLMKEACRYASLKLTEIESRAHFRDSIHLPD
jgi:hypothetical protein